MKLSNLFALYLHLNNSIGMSQRFYEKNFMRVITRMILPNLKIFPIEDI